MTLKEYLEQATYAYIGLINKSSLLTRLWSEKGVLRAEQYLIDNQNETEEKILSDLKSSESALASSTDYKAFVALAVLAYQNKCSVDILLVAITACARDRQSTMPPIVSTAQVCALPDIETLKNSLISSCINGCESDKAFLAKKVKSILALSELAYELNCTYRKMADAAVACLDKLKRTTPNLTMPVLLKKLLEKDSLALKALSLELNEENNELEMDDISDKVPPRRHRA